MTLLSAINSTSLLIVGAGFGQVPAILAAHELGLRSLVVDRDVEAPGMILADTAEPIDLLDLEAVIAAARVHSVAGVLTMQSDIGVPTVGAVVDALRLPGNGRDVADRCSNKIATRRCLAEKNVPQPKFEVVKTAGEACIATERIGFPCVIKAPDSSGSRGVVKVCKAEQVEAAVTEAMQHTRGNELLVEEFIAGIEIGAQGFSMNGQCLVALIHDDAVSAPPYMIPVGHAFPSSLNTKTLTVTETAIKAAVDALGIQTGPSNIDLIIDDKGQARIIEIGARIGATCLPELVFYHTGIDWVKQAIRAALGEAPELNKYKEQACAAFILEAPEDGFFHGFHLPPTMKNHPDVLEWEVTARVGQSVFRLRKGTDRIGKVVTRGNTPEDAIDLAQQFRTALTFDIRTER